jgi:SET domain-containing protein
LFFSEGKYWIPEQGIQTLCITHFLNHSKQPNLTTTPDGDIFIAVRDIKKGEELTVDYGQFDELEEDFR